MDDDDDTDDNDTDDDTDDDTDGDDDDDCVVFSVIRSTAFTTSTVKWRCVAGSIPQLLK